ncbi:MAG: hypothetical protein IJF17_00935 [Thermoguttaceae bacterium]|nr:hypothetical protein [Thermoguttaceae bacterium]
MRSIAFILKTKSFQTANMKHVSMIMAFKTGGEFYIYRGDPSGQNGELIPYAGPTHEPKYAFMEEVPDDIEILSLTLNFQPEEESADESLKHIERNRGCDEAFFGNIQMRAVRTADAVPSDVDQGIDP